MTAEQAAEAKAAAPGDIVEVPKASPTGPTTTAMVAVETVPWFKDPAFIVSTVMTILSFVIEVGPNVMQVLAEEPNKKLNVGALIVTLGTGFLAWDRKRKNKVVR